MSRGGHVKLLSHHVVIQIKILKSQSGKKYLTHDLAILGTILVHSLPYKLGQTPPSPPPGLESRTLQHQIFQNTIFAQQLQQIHTCAESWLWISARL